MPPETKIPAIYRPGRVAKREPFTPAKIRSKVDELLISDRSNLRNAVLEMLYEFVILTEASLFWLVYDQVEISGNPASFHRRLNDYAKDGLIERVSRHVIKQAVRAGLPRPKDGTLRAYRLGPVGEELARIKFVNEVRGPLIAIEAEEYQAHDLICAEAMFKIQKTWQETPNEKFRSKIEVRGPRMLTIWDAEHQKAILAPDGLMIRYDLAGNFLHALIVEYHNTNAKMHVENKVAKYEALASEKKDWLWETWDLDDMPLVVALYRQDVTLQHYISVLRSTTLGRDTGAKYFSQSLSEVWEGKIRILPIEYKPK